MSTNCIIHLSRWVILLADQQWHLKMIKIAIPPSDQVTDCCKVHNPAQLTHSLTPSLALSLTLSLPPFLPPSIIQSLTHSLTIPLSLSCFKKRIACWDMSPCLFIGDTAWGDWEHCPHTVISSRGSRKPHMKDGRTLNNLIAIFLLKGEG